MIMSTRRLGLIAGSALLVAALGGCASDSLENESITQIRMNPTPTEKTMTQSEDEIDNMTYGIVFDQNFLQLREYLNRFLLLERPSRLTYYPVAY